MMDVEHHTKGQAVTYTLSDGNKIQNVTDVVTGTGSVVRAKSFCIVKEEIKMLIRNLTWSVLSDLLARSGIGGVGKLGEVPTVKPALDSNPHSSLASLSTSRPYSWAPIILLGEGK